MGIKEKCESADWTEVVERVQRHALLNMTMHLLLP
jgi:hypothetical protein